MAESSDPSPTHDQRGQRVDYQVNVAPGGVANLTLPAPRPRLFANVPPAPPEGLVGHDALLADLVQGLTHGQARALSTDGQGGVGKTALAIAVAHHPAITAYFAGGVMWASVGPGGGVRFLSVRARVLRLAPGQPG